jgi:hypothetical protein
MLFDGWRIEGPFAGIDPMVIVGSLALVGAIIAVVASLAFQVARLQPKVPQAGASTAKRASNEFDNWTERPKGSTNKDAEYQALYGSRPGPPSYVSSQAPGAPAPPPLGEVVVNLGGGAPPEESRWVDVPPEQAASGAPWGPPLSPLRPPPRPTGPTDEVIAPAHSRRGRDSSTGMLPSEETPNLLFERSSAAPGALPPRMKAGDPYSPKAPASPPTPAPRRGLDEASKMKVAQTLPDAPPAPAPARGTFRQPSRDRAVVGAGATGVQEGEVLSAGTKAIRCPKCATVFAGPTTRPATVRCPACGTTGNLK